MGPAPFQLPREGEDGVRAAVFGEVELALAAHPLGGDVERDGVEPVASRAGH